ncbi:MAG: hypothetical protein KDB88_13065 [Flavobacteriales bacterium]|nr:hypothetical protein [Flavobacteriales bacterium]
MNGNQVPDDVVSRSGGGFRIDHAEGKIISKYTCGVAMLLAPFYACASFIAGPTNSDSWGPTHYAAVDVAGIFYFILGLLLIHCTLMEWEKGRNDLTWLSLVCIAFGTNLFFYAFVEPAFSHVYSFFLVALSLFLAIRSRRGPWNMWSLFLFATSNALIVLIRPVDIIAVLALYALLFVAAPNLLGSKRVWLVQGLMFFIISAPQMLYWKHVFGEWVVYSYAGEGFTNWAAPKIAEVLAAPLNGLLPHAPVFALLPLGLWAIHQRDRIMALIFAAMFALILYTCAAWHSWHFGCAYGMRPLVQYTPFLALGLYALFCWAKDHRVGLLHGAMPMIVLICFVNYRFMLYKEICYPGETWDWKYYGRELAETFFGSLPTEHYR